MYKLLIKFFICISVVCYSASLLEYDEPTFEKILLKGFDSNLKQMKQTYFTRISEFKQRAVNCTLDGSCFGIAEKVKVSFCFNVVSLANKFKKM